MELRGIFIRVAFFAVLCVVCSLAVSLNSEGDKILYLLRHAKSDKSNPSLKDFDRPLNKRGYSDSPMMGKVLAGKGVKPDLIIASPSRRTRETILPIAEAIGYDTSKIVWNRSLYRCSHSQYIQEIHKINDKYRLVMIVGHNAATTTVSNVLQKDSVIDNVSTCGIVAIDLKNIRWKEVGSASGEFVFFDRPKNHRP